MRNIEGSLIGNALRGLATSSSESDTNCNLRDVQLVGCGEAGHVMPSTDLSKLGTFLAAASECDRTACSDEQPTIGAPDAGA